MTEIDYSTLDLKSLQGEKARYAALKKAAEKGIKEIDAEIARRYESLAREAFRRIDKEHGTVTVTTNDGVALKAEIARTVSYDSEALMRVAMSMPYAQATKLFQFKVTVPERVYAGLAAEPTLQTAVDATRTVTYGDLKITIKDDEK